ncbi:hypothetical protein TorRG33x02_111380 [Trema orientale]|uniref:DUF7731 domain-containing protein n=1 Tax=Trema orientale TaxID=63057 RepID=A0A2P5F628_TREOI|nr:hypothetical protein TorRG33x02_111380 [Trema orientale]
MALVTTLRLWVLASALFLPYVFGSISGKAEEDHGPDQFGNNAGYDPAQVVAKALLCFNDKYIYSSCEESYRLTESGNLDVPPDKTEAYCGGPCLTETHLVLNCIDNILANFVFYNRATIQDIRDTIHAGCGYGPERGNFNVAGRIEAEENKAERAGNQILVGFGLMVVVYCLLSI